MISLKQKQFALSYVKNGGNSSKAARKLSITAGTASKWLSIVEVSEYVEQLQSDVAAQAGVDQLWVLKKYKTVYNDAMKGYETAHGTRKDLVAAKGALDSISNMLGYNAPTKVSVEVDLSTWLTQQAKPQLPQEITDAEIE